MRLFLTVLAVALAAYVAFGALIFVGQSRMVHLPDIPGRELAATPAQLGLDYRDLQIPAADGLTLHGWHVPAADPLATVLFFHGNAGNISHRLETIRILHGVGLEVVIFDYRGYGRSDGSPSEAGIHRDAVHVVDFVREQLGVPDGRLVYHGRSLGGAVAAGVARERPPGALVLESTFRSAQAMARELYPFYPTRWLTRLEYDAEGYLQAMEPRPVLVVHSPHDEIVPFAHAERLAEVAPGPAALLRLEGDHNTGFLRSEERYRQGLTDFLQRHVGR